MICKRNAYICRIESTKCQKQSKKTWVGVHLNSCARPKPWLKNTKQTKKSLPNTSTPLPVVTKPFNWQSACSCNHKTGCRLTTATTAFYSGSAWSPKNSCCRCLLKKTILFLVAARTIRIRHWIVRINLKFRINLRQRACKLFPQPELLWAFNTKRKLVKPLGAQQMRLL